MATRKKHRRKKSPRRLTRLKKWVKKHVRRHRWMLLCIVGVLCLLVYHAYFRTPSPQETSARTSAGYDGIDVSRYQGTIDWEAVAQDRYIQFVYIKATEGASRVDRMYRRNLSQAREAGLKVGSYHFFTSRSSVEAQFENFRSVVDRSQQDLLPVIDVEESGVRQWNRQQLQRNLSAFMDLVKGEYGRYPILYSQYRFYNEMLAPEFNRFYIFIARYGHRKPTLRGSGKYNIWQYSEKGNVGGISGYVDLDRFDNGTSLSDISL